MTQTEIKELRELVLRKYKEAVENEHGFALVSQLRAELRHWDEQLDLNATVLKDHRTNPLGEDLNPEDFDPIQKL